MRRSLLLLPVLLIFALVALSVHGVRARGTLDQSFTPTPDAADLIINGEPGVLGQTFTAGISGLLDTVSLALTADGTPATATVSIFATDNTGMPNPAALLASATATVTQSAQPTDPSLYTFVSFSTPATVSAGQVYAIVISNAHPGDDAIDWWFSGGSTYARGQGVSADAIGGPYTSIGDNISFDFQTFVTPAAAASPSAVASATQATLSVGAANLPSTITVATSGCGSVSPPSPILTSGVQNAVVRAIPCPGSSFIGWVGGPCNGTTINPCDIAPPAAVTAAFAP